jgi:hypothetical protein
VPAGAVAAIVVDDVTVNDAAAVAPTLTAVTPAKPLPVMVTTVPPRLGPAVGLRPATLGRGDL